MQESRGAQARTPDNVSDTRVKLMGQQKVGKTDTGSKAHKKLMMRNQSGNAGTTDHGRGSPIKDIFLPSLYSFKKLS